MPGKLKGQMQALEEGDLKPEQVTEIARLLDVQEQDVVNMNRRLSAPDNSLNSPVRQDGDGEWQDWLVDTSENQEEVLGDREIKNSRRTLLADALKTLKPRERQIIVERRLREEPVTLETLAQKLGISRERVRQIEARGFERLQKAMKDQVAQRRAIA